MAPRKSAQKEQEAQKRSQDARRDPSAEAPKEEGKRLLGAAKKEAPKKSSETTHLEAGFGIILRPHVSEKTARLGSRDTYAFAVKADVNKIEIKKAFSKMYGVRPVSVRIANMPARATQFRRIPGMQSAWKKAYIRVPKGSAIAVYEGV